MYVNKSALTHLFPNSIQAAIIHCRLIFGRGRHFSPRKLGSLRWRLLRWMKKTVRKTNWNLSQLTVGQLISTAIHSRSVRFEWIDVLPSSTIFQSWTQTGSQTSTTRSTWKQITSRCQSIKVVVKMKVVGRVEVALCAMNSVGYLTERLLGYWSGRKW